MRYTSAVARRCHGKLSVHLPPSTPRAKKEWLPGNPQDAATMPCFLRLKTGIGVRVCVCARARVLLCVCSSFVTQENDFNRQAKVETLVTVHTCGCHRLQTKILVLFLYMWLKAVGRGGRVQSGGEGNVIKRKIHVH